MPILIFLLLIVLIATFGFWETLQAILGAIGLLVLLALIFAGLAAVIVLWLIRR